MTTQTEHLAKQLATIAMGSIGYTPTMIERAWKDDATGREVFLDAAATLIPGIKAEALREASDDYPLETAFGGAEHAVLWLKDRANQIGATA